MLKIIMHSLLFTLIIIWIVLNIINNIKQSELNDLVLLRAKQDVKELCEMATYNNFILKGDKK